MRTWRFKRHDISYSGVSPSQAAIGRQPQLQGDVLGSFGQRLAENGLIDLTPIRQVAMRDTARVAMARLRFSRGLRRAMMSGSRTTTMAQQLEPGASVYHFKMQKNNIKTSNQKKKLS